MFNEIVAIANERVVTAADFKPFDGQYNWLAFEKAEELGKAADVPDEPWLSGVVYRFRILGVLVHMNKVTIDIDLGIAGMKRVQMDPDELALRMDES